MLENARKILEYPRKCKNLPILLELLAKFRKFPKTNYEEQVFSNSVFDCIKIA